MAGSLNKVMLIGNLGKDPEIRDTQSGKKMATLSIATSETWGKGSDRQEKTEWHRVVIFNEGLAKVAESYLQKGSKIYVEGTLQTRKWTNRDGQDVYTTEVVLGAYGSTLTMLSERFLGAGQQREEPPADNYSGSSQSGGSEDLDDEIPF